jgi:hypothetical protein
MGPIGQFETVVVRTVAVARVRVEVAYVLSLLNL